MIRMLIIGYVFAIRSERALCRDVQVNFAYRWFCGLSIEDKIPDHSAFSRARNERFRDSDIFRSVFERVVGVCLAAGLVGGVRFSFLPMLVVSQTLKARAKPWREKRQRLWKAMRCPATKADFRTPTPPPLGAGRSVSPNVFS